MNKNHVDLHLIGLLHQPLCTLFQSQYMCHRVIFPPQIIIKIIMIKMINNKSIYVNNILIKLISGILIYIGVWFIVCEKVCVN